jgi:hypothetical protein
MTIFGRFIENISKSSTRIFLIFEHDLAHDKSFRMRPKTHTHTHTHTHKHIHTHRQTERSQ